jgi:hypothetical protein
MKKPALKGCFWNNSLYDRLSRRLGELNLARLRLSRESGRFVAHGQERQKCRQAILGLFRLPRLQRDCEHVTGTIRRAPEPEEPPFLISSFVPSSNLIPIILPNTIHRSRQKNIGRKA